MSEYELLDDPTVPFITIEAVRKALAAIPPEPPFKFEMSPAYYRELVECFPPSRAFSPVEMMVLGVPVEIKDIPVPWRKVVITPDKE